MLTPKSWPLAPNQDLRQSFLKRIVRSALVIEQTNPKRVVSGNPDRSVVRNYCKAEVGDGNEMGSGEV